MAPPRRIRVYLADDHPLFLESMASAVLRQPALELVGSAQNGREALEGLRRLRPDVAVVDLRMPGMGGDEVIIRAVEEGLPTRVLALSAYTEDARVYETLAAGAAGYLSKEMDRECILDAMRVAASGEAVIAGAVQSGLVREIRRREALARPRLSGRELEVLALAAQGRSTPEIAGDLELSAATVKSHLQKIF